MASNFRWTIGPPSTMSSAWQAIDRALWYRRRADGVGGGEWEAFKNDLATAIVWGRAALNHLAEEHERRPGFRKWFDGLYQQHPILDFFRQERNSILKARPLAIHG